MQLYSHSEILHFQNIFVFYFGRGGEEHTLRPPYEAKKFISPLHACKSFGPYKSPFFHTCKVDSSVFGMQILYKCLWDLFRIIFGVQKKNMVYFWRFYRCFYFIYGIIWIVDRFMLLVYMYFGDKESISLDVDFLYWVSSICFCVL